MLKKYGDQRFIGASIGSATGGVPQNDRAFASLSIATQSAEYTTCAKTSPLKNPLPQVASRSANGLLAAISSADLPAAFSFCTRSRVTTSMSRYLVRYALLLSGPCPGTIGVLLSAKVNHVGLLEVNIDVRVGMRRLEILQHHDFAVGLQFLAVAECLLRQSIRRECRKVQTEKRTVVWLCHARLGVFVGQHCGARGVQIGVIVRVVE